MKSFRIFAFAALVGVSLTATASAENCSLGLMAALDITMMPDGRFAVPVSINGTTHEFMVDTSGVFSALAEESAHKLGLKEIETPMELYGVKGKEHIYSVNIDSFKVGNVEAKHFHLVVSRGGKQGSQQDPPQDAMVVDGFLAPDFLNLFDVELDFAAKKMNLFSQDHCPGKVVYWTQGGHVELPFHYTAGTINAVPHINFQMTLDGHDISTDLDTGSANSWLRSKAALQMFDVDEKSPGVARSPLNSDAVPTFRKQFALLSLGGLTVQNPQVDIIPDQEEASFRMEHSEKSRDDPIYGANFNPEDFTLGMNVISKLHLYIAYKKHKIYITAADAH
jgi:hypothetical protein